MGKYIMSKGTIGHYTSFTDLRAAFDLKEVSYQTKDAQKLKSQRENFCNKHKCRACGYPMTYSGGNIMTCTNPSCKGIKHEKTDSEGNVIVTYSTSYDILNDKYANIAQNIFA